MTNETRTCQNCKQEFVIEPEDFAFYDTMQVPPPTWCPECRMIRRMAMRNERSLYRRQCDRCGVATLSIYPAGCPFTVYCVQCWHSDAWDPLSYGKEYDPSKNFFVQYRELMEAVPRIALYQDFVEASEYTNYAIYLKNCYLVFGGHHYEQCCYSSQNHYLNDCYDVDFCMKCERCSHSVHLKRCSGVHYSAYTEECEDSWFLFNCRNCRNCIGCTNLRNRSYCIFNGQYTKEEYEKRLREFNFGRYENVRAFRERHLAESLKYPRKYAWIRNAINSTGDDLENVKNVIRCFVVSEGENCRYSFHLPSGNKDVYDADHVGLGTELAYEQISGVAPSRSVAGNRIFSSHDLHYCDDCHSSAYLFGCIGLKSKEYCILNTPYSKEEYEKLVAHIIECMQAEPYRDGQGRVYGYGEFFPPELMPFAYNESTAQDYFPTTKEAAGERGYTWKEVEKKEYTITLPSSKLPEDVTDADTSILENIIGCEHRGRCNEQCTTAFRIILQELQFCRKENAPLPRLCPNCRHGERMKMRNPMRLYRRGCQCSGGTSLNGVYINTATHRHGTGKCPNEFETSYPPAGALSARPVSPDGETDGGRASDWRAGAPDGPEIIYCEQCYNAEVA